MDRLLELGLSCVTVLDISVAALERARARLGDAAARVRWIAADVAGSDWQVPPVDLWHDRAVFHFLTEPAARRRYADRLAATLKPGGAAVLATFALDGPRKCSGLDVCRYSSETLSAELGAAFVLELSEREEHTTPSGAIQAFQWSVFRKVR